MSRAQISLLVLRGYDASVTGAQCIAARTLLGWSQRHLAQQAGVSPVTLVHFEKPQEGRAVHRRTIFAIRSALETAGIEFTGPPGQTEVPPMMSEIHLTDGTTVRLRRQVISEV